MPRRDGTGRDGTGRDVTRRDAARRDATGRDGLERRYCGDLWRQRILVKTAQTNVRILAREIPYWEPPRRGNRTDCCLSPTSHTFYVRVSKYVYIYIYIYASQLRPIWETCCCRSRPPARRAEMVGVQLALIITIIITIN